MIGWVDVLDKQDYQRWEAGAVPIQGIVGGEGD